MPVGNGNPAGVNPAGVNPAGVNPLPGRGDASGNGDTSTMTTDENILPYDPISNQNALNAFMQEALDSARDFCARWEKPIMEPLCNSRSSREELSDLEFMRYVDEVGSRFLRPEETSGQLRASYWKSHFITIRSLWRGHAVNSWKQRSARMAFDEPYGHLIDGPWQDEIVFSDGQIGYLFPHALSAEAYDVLRRRAGQGQGDPDLHGITEILNHLGVDGSKEANARRQAWRRLKADGTLEPYIKAGAIQNVGGRWFGWRSRISAASRCVTP